MLSFRLTWRESRSDLLAIVLAWLGILALCGGLQLAGYSLGFDVWPLGEDWTWIKALKSGGPSQIAHSSWAMADRNPLIVWWYILAKPVILGVDSGMLLLRHFMRLTVAIFSYLVLVGTAGQRSRHVALAVGILIAVFSANGYLDNLQWPLLGVLSVSLATIWTYLQFAKSGRRTYGWYGASLVLWFVALTSYTLQSGAALAIGLTVVWPTALPTSRWRERMSRAVLDLLPYGVIFVLYSMIWKTVSNPSSYHLKPDLDALAESLWFGIWHYDYTLFLNWFGGPLSTTGRCVSFLGVGLCLYGIMRWRQRPLIGAYDGCSGLILSALVAVCLVLPTIVVESLAPDTWPPGTRWKMVQPFWLPIFTIVLLEIVFFTFRFLRRADRAWCGSVAAVGALFVLVSFGFNSAQVTTTRVERALNEGLRGLLAEDAARGIHVPQNILIKLEPGVRWPSSDVLSPDYAASWFPGQDVSFRILQVTPAPTPAWTAWWRVRFGPDDMGASNVRVGGGKAPYTQVQIASFDGHHLRPIETATAETFAGLQVDWDRSSPIVNPLTASLLALVPKSPGCTFEWTASTDVPSSLGWSVPEHDEHGPFRWTVADTATLWVPRCGTDMRVEVALAFAVSEANITGIRVSLAGHELAFERRSDEGTVLLAGRVALPADAPRIVPIAIRVPKLDTIPGASRQLGVAVRSIRVQTVP
jgi:hypothetical protein